MQDVKLARRVSHSWRDRAVGWAQWHGLVTCPQCGRQFRCTFSGTRTQADAFECNCETCDEE